MAAIFARSPGRPAMSRWFHPVAELFSPRSLTMPLRPKSVFPIAFTSKSTWAPTPQKLEKRGVKRLAVVCPAFVADCLETLEEIGLRAAETFREAGGESLTLVPAVNASTRFISGLAAALKEAP